MATVSVTTGAELATAIGNSDEIIHLNAATFTMGATVTVDYDCVIDITYVGDVVIELGNTFSFIIDDSGGATTIVIGDSTGTYQITFNEGNADSMRVQSSAAAVDATFHYCSFTNANATKGLSILSDPVGDVTVTCNNCTAHDNTTDGFSITGTNDNGVLVMLILNDCSAYNHTTGSSSDGITAHAGNQFLIINGGFYYNNYNGVSVIGDGGEGPTVYVNGTTFYDCFYGVKVLGTTNVFGVDLNCVNVYAPKDNGYGVRFSGLGSFTIRNSILTGKTAVISGIYIDGNSSQGAVNVLNCLVKDWGGNYGGLGFITLGTLKSAIIDHCTFYNNKRGIRTGTKKVVCTNTIFANQTETGWFGETGADRTYIASGLNGNNIFYGNVSADFRAGQNDTYAENDLQLDPKFVNPGSDFTLKPNSPCLNTGSPSPQGGYTSIGAWQRISIAKAGIGSINIQGKT